MHVVVRTDLGDADVDVQQIGEGETLADLLRVVTGRRIVDGVSVDGRHIAVDAPLVVAGLARGSLIDLTAAPSATSAPSGRRTTNAAAPRWELAQVAGFDAGGRIPAPERLPRTGAGIGSRQHPPGAPTCLGDTLHRRCRWRPDRGGTGERAR